MEAEHTHKLLALSDREIETRLPAFVMGIVNMTPDSFWAGSRYGNDALKAALSLAEDAADIIDIGGESTRPGAVYVSAADEITRIVPLIAAFRKRCGAPVSVDTRKKEVMQAAYEAGADMLNDVSALEDDPDMAAFAAEKKIPVVLMHKRGEPAIMQENTAYADVFAQVNAYLLERADYALSCGIAENRLILDPGVGFGKDLAANAALIRRCGCLGGGRFPVLVGLSRKTFAGEITGRPVQDRLASTLAAGLVAVMNGASILRVHDVRETVDCLKTLRSLA